MRQRIAPCAIPFSVEELNNRTVDELFDMAARCLRDLRQHVVTYCYKTGCIIDELRKRQRMTHKQIREALKSRTRVEIWSSTRQNQFCQVKRVCERFPQLFPANEITQKAVLLDTWKEIEKAGEQEYLNWGRLRQVMSVLAKWLIHTVRADVPHQ